MDSAEFKKKGRKGPKEPKRADFNRARFCLLIWFFLNFRELVIQNFELQFAWVIVNYDLKLRKRVSRFRRLRQKRASETRALNDRVKNALTELVSYSIHYSCMRRKRRKHADILIFYKGPKRADFIFEKGRKRLATLDLLNQGHIDNNQVNLGLDWTYIFQKF